MIDSRKIAELEASDQSSKLVSDLCDRFETAWCAGESPRIEEHLRDLPAGLEERAMYWLLTSEVACRIRLGDTPTVEDYLGRFSRYSDIVFAALFQYTCLRCHRFSNRSPRAPSCPYCGGEICDVTNTTPVTSRELGQRLLNPLERLDLSERESTPLLSDPKTTLSQAPVSPERARAAFPWVHSRYELKEELGRGGMGVVYRAYDRQRQHEVALKVLPRDDPASLYLFKHEFRALADVFHTNVAVLYDLITDGSRWWLTMELIKGENFRKYIRTGPVGELRFDERRLRDALRQLAQGLEHLHSQGKLHRDLKPSNVLVEKETERVVIVDFGLAADLTRGGVYHSTVHHLRGTLAYMSPEQAAIKPLSSASDWYSVGVMLYEALTGQVPVYGSPSELLAKKQAFDPTSPSSLVSKIPSDLDALCLALLQLKPEDRPTGREVLARLGCGADFKRLSHAASLQHSGILLVGRERHLEALHEAFCTVRRGRTVVVDLHGSSGMGKTALAQAFTDDVQDNRNALILSGRCYEQESVPYKAVDGVVDALARALYHWPESDVLAVLPRDAASLVRLFPVLGRVEAVANAPRREVEIPDPHESRQRSFGALRELLARLGDRHPLVIHIDDVQWGDLDSAILLAELLRPPDPPTFLLLLGYRTEDIHRSPFLRTFGHAIESTQETFVRKDLIVGGLSPAESRALALSLLGRTEATAVHHAETTAREAQGNPFFVHELVQHFQSTSVCTEDSAGFEVRLDEVIFRRAQELTSAERRLLEVTAVAGWPVSLKVACRAASWTSEHPLALTHLRSGRLLRMTGSASQLEIEPYHDRVREAITARLPEELRREHHVRLAQALEDFGEGDSEARAVHFHYGGRPQRAADYYAQAAQDAAEVLAFNRSASLYQSALELMPHAHGNRQELLVKLAAALANAGRGQDSAENYLAAAAESEPSARNQLEHRAATQLLISGNVDRGLQVIEGVLRAIGARLPSTPRQVFLRMIWLRARLRLRGYRFIRRDEEQIESTKLAYIDACWSAAVGLTMVDPIRSFYFHTLGFLHALREGETKRIARGLCFEAMQLAAGGEGNRVRASKVLGIVEELAASLNDPYTDGIVSLGKAMVAQLAGGRWKQSYQYAQQAIDILGARCTGVFWEIDTAYAYVLWSLLSMGSLIELRSRLSSIQRDAEYRGDVYAATMLSEVRFLTLIYSDDMEGAKRYIEECRYRWSRKGFDLQHLNLLRCRIQVDLFEMNFQSAWRRIMESWPHIERSCLLRVQVLRVLMVHARGNIALAAAMNASNRAELLQIAQRDARQLENERTPWAAALSCGLRAGIAAMQNQRSKSVELLEDAVACFESADMYLLAACAMRRLGQMVGGEKGQELIRRADEVFAQQQIRHPQVVTRAAMPGFDAEET